MLGDGKRIKLFSRGSGVVRERDGDKSSEVERQDWKGKRGGHFYWGPMARYFDGNNEAQLFCHYEGVRLERPSQSEANLRLVIFNSQRTVSWLSNSSLCATTARKGL